MKNLSILRVLSACVILCASIAFSCQDHEVPENPEQPLNCTLLDGTTRPFPCEFKIVKIEFLRGTTNEVLDTVTPGDLAVSLDNWGGYSRSTSSGNYVIINYRMRVTIERIANPTVESPGGYDFYLTSTHFTNDQPKSPRYFPITPVPVNIKIGETFSFIHTAGVEFSGSTANISLAPEFMIINNIAIEDMLSKPPYSYLFRRDRAEAYIGFDISLY